MTPPRPIDPALMKLCTGRCATLAEASAMDDINHMEVRS